ncbi:sensor histidine kinase [Spirillospora albida]|uniref:sensor histidine kinase n=1 Tax=Spirillospora albida TaxID=58123 RepID=UPI0004C2812A|nr:sensor histidine kinase [Spirillospora albida]
MLSAVSGVRRPSGRAADAAFAGGVFLLVGLATLHSLLGAREESWGATAMGWALIFAACASLAWRHRYPVAVTAFTLVVTGVYYVASAYDGPLMVVYVIALYGVAAAGRLRSAVVLGLLGVLGTGAGTLAGNDDVTAVALFMFTGWLVGMVSLGWARHSRLAYAREAERRAAGEERLRIARELHDVVGHHLSMINVQAAAALRRMRKNPEVGVPQAETALAEIKRSSREALGDLRATLGILRRPGEAAPLAPAADGAWLDELAASARLADLDVRTRIGGAGHAPPTEVRLAAYRVVQESLTNVARHAHATRVDVRVECAPGLVTVEVVDDGRGPARAESSGSGIAGMRERARALGGELTAGPAPGGGFAVRAVLPFTGTEPRS